MHSANAPCSMRTSSGRRRPSSRARPRLDHRDLVRSDNGFFAATGITDGDLLQGVRYGPASGRTESLVMRSKSGTVRRITAQHRIA